MLATVGRPIPGGGDWILEPEFDGWRIVAHVTREALGCRRETAAATTVGCRESPRRSQGCRLAVSWTASSSAWRRSRAGACAAAWIASARWRRAANSGGAGTW
jgi:hypothetical protein